jgi:hypothetical protein
MTQAYTPTKPNAFEKLFNYAYEGVVAPACTSTADLAMRVGADIHADIEVRLELFQEDSNGNIPWNMLVESKKPAIRNRLATALLR